VAIFGEMYISCGHKVTQRQRFRSKIGNQLIKTYDVDILCGYSLSSVQGGMDSHISNKSARAFSRLFPVNGLSAVFLQ
jgi:hypothetical protein